MSYSSVSQGLQSCLEPKLIEPRVLRLKLAPPGSNSNHSSHSEWPNSSSSNSSCIEASFSNFEAYKNPTSQNNTDNEHDMKCAKDSFEPSGDGGCTWSFLQSLSNISHCNSNGGIETEDGVYVHPKVKCSSTVLSAKSLEMCTESLGSETGSICSSNASEISDEMSLLSLENDSTSFMRNNTMQVNTNYEPKRLNRGSSFPPPLTSITDFGGMKVRPHREDGRLILEAVTTTPFQSYFRAERSDGRLRLSLFESVSSYYGGDEDEVTYEEQEQEEEEDEGEEGETLSNEACDEEESGSKDEIEKYEMDMTKFTTPSRCKESGRKRDIFGDGYFEIPSLSLCL